MNKDFFEIYKIKKGDTIYAIGMKYNINPELIALMNGLTMSDYIYENQEIKIPKVGYSYYLTKSGDTLNDVFKLFNVEYNSVSKGNNKILLEEGQLLAYKRL